MDLIEQLSEVLVDRQDLVEAVGCLLAAKEDDLAGQRDAIAGLEEKVAGHEEVLNRNSKTIEGYQGEVDQLKAQLGRAVEKYREAVLTAAPELPAELLTGASIAEIDASLENARIVVQKVKERFDLQTRTTTVPAGAPARSEPNVDVMSAREKIEYGLRAGARG